MDRRSLSRIERMNYIIGGVLVALCGAVGTREQVLGALVGVLLGALNFTLVRHLVEKMLAAAQGKESGSGLRGSAVLVLPKMLILLGATSAALLLLPISPVYLAIGFSVFLVSIAVETVRYVLRRPSETRD